MSWRGLYRTPWCILALVSISFVGLNVVLSYKEIDISPISVGGSVPIGGDANVVPDSIITSDELRLSATLSRPLFSPTRQQFVPKPKPVEQAVTQSAAITQKTQPVARPTITFQGTRMIGQERRALVQFAGAERADWLPVGAQVSGWTIADIGDTNLVLSQKDQFASYELFGSEGKEQGDSTQLSANSPP